MLARLLIVLVINVFIPFSLLASVLESAVLSLLDFESAEALRIKGFVHPQNAPTRRSERASVAFTIFVTVGE